MSLFLISCFNRDLSDLPEKIYFENDICKCPEAFVGETKEINGITYKVVALQVFENTLPKVDYKSKKNKSETNNPNKIENYFGTSKKNDSEDEEDEEEENDLF